MKLIFLDAPMNDYYLHELGLLDIARDYANNNKWKCDGQPYLIDAGMGISNVLIHFEVVFNGKDNPLIITNSTELLNCVEHKNDIYFALIDELFRNITIKPIQECCDRKIRDDMNIQKLYLSGVFGNVYIPERMK